MAMTDAARDARNKYQREWLKKNPEKQREYQERYWKRKAESDRRKTAENGGNDGEQV